MRAFQGLAALLALFMVYRHGRAALGFLRPRSDGPPAGRLSALPSLLTCLLALAVLALAVRGLLDAP